MALAYGWRPSSRMWAREAAMALMLALAVGAVPIASARAQTVATARPAVTVHGSGEATAPAVTATVQILIGLGGREFGFSEDEFGGGGFESGSEFVAVLDPAATPGAEPEATPTAMDEDADGREGRRGRRDRPERQPLSAERLAPIVEAVAASGGLAPDAVEIDLSPLAVEPFGPAQESARLDFEIAQPEPDALNAIVAAASETAAANGMVIEIAGVRYNPADCAVLEEAATVAAIEDARARAERLAGLLDVTLGGVIGASSDPFSFGAFGPQEEDTGCSGQQSSIYDSGYGGLGITVPVFDPSAEAEVEVYAVLTVSYEIVEE